MALGSVLASGGMKAAVLRSAPGKLEIEELTIPEPQPHEVVIRTSHAGLCHSDLNIIDGVFPYPLPVVMGHEAAGVVEAVGSNVTYVAPGDHVITCLSSFCGACRFCLSGRPHLCSSRVELRALSRPLLDGDGQPVSALVGLGTFAEQMVVHEHAVAKVRADMPLDIASLLGCGVTTGLGAALRTAHIEPGSSAAVIGCGGIGLAAVQGALLAGASPVIAIDIAEDKLRRAKRIGATHIIDASVDDPVAAVQGLTGGGVDYSFEAIGSKKTAEQAVAMLAMAGVATVIGMVPMGETVDIPGTDLFMLEKRVQGSNMGSNRFRYDMPWFCDLYMEGRLKLDEFVTAHRPLDEVNEGYDDMRRGEGLRTVIDFA